MNADAFRDLRSRLDVRCLHVDSANTELLVSEILLIMRRHVVLDEIAVALDATNKVSLVPADVEVAMANLPVIIRADRVIAAHLLAPTLEMRVQAVLEVL